MTGFTARCGVWFFPNLPAPELIAAIGHAERVGLDELWLGDEGPAREPFAVLAAAATTTSTIRLGVGITNPYVRHPAVAVAAMATIAELAPGRALLGVGAGGTMSLAPFELEAARPVEAVSRFIDIAEASAAGEDTDGYVANDIAVASHVPRVPVYVGARGPRLNRLASQRADGAFVAGMPPFRYDEVIGWAHSARPIDIALYPSVAFGEAGRERHRPEMIWSLLNAPAHSLARFDLDPADVTQAAVEVRSGSPDRASRLITDEILDELMIVGDPDDVGARLAGLSMRHQPSSIGVALIDNDLEAAIDHAASAFAAMRRAIAASEESR